MSARRSGGGAAMARFERSEHSGGSRGTRCARVLGGGASGASAGGLHWILLLLENSFILRSKGRLCVDSISWKYAYTGLTYSYLRKSFAGAGRHPQCAS